jgi:hypothetical protein
MLRENIGGVNRAVQSGATNVACWGRVRDTQ